MFQKLRKSTRDSLYPAEREAGRSRQISSVTCIQIQSLHLDSTQREAHGGPGSHRALPPQCWTNPPLTLPNRGTLRGAPGGAEARSTRGMHPRPSLTWPRRALCLTCLEDHLAIVLGPEGLQHGHEEYPAGVLNTEHDPLHHMAASITASWPSGGSRGLGIPTRSSTSAPPAAATSGIPSPAPRAAGGPGAEAEHGCASLVPRAAAGSSWEGTMARAAPSGAGEREGAVPGGLAEEPPSWAGGLARPRLKAAEPTVAGAAARPTREPPGSTASTRFNRRPGRQQLLKTPPRHTP